mmetsp:Transcript_13647/g.27213  ORF Transcript_13647/g.27213 Transcript_13647/m.27213 type:complete len:95 (-) Transcript_13647:192-476(-)
MEEEYIIKSKNISQLQNVPIAQKISAGTGWPAVTRPNSRNSTTSGIADGSAFRTSQKVQHVDMHGSKRAYEVDSRCTTSNPGHRALMSDRGEGR